jgi:hypothetical protein
MAKRPKFSSAVLPQNSADTGILGIIFFRIIHILHLQHFTTMFRIPVKCSGF